MMREKDFQGKQLSAVVSLGCRAVCEMQCDIKTAKYFVTLPHYLLRSSLLQGNLHSFETAELSC